MTQNRMSSAPNAYCYSSLANKLYIDFMHENGFPFLSTMSGKLNYRTIRHCSNYTVNTIKKVLDNVQSKYTNRGFEHTVYHGENEFSIQNLHNHLNPALLHIYAANEHVGLLERGIRAVKDRSRCICHAAPYRRYPKLMVTYLLDHVVTNLNDFHSKNSISYTISPGTIVEGVSKADMRYNRIAFGFYAIVWIRTRNDMKWRAAPAIALNQSNRHGGHYFMSLNTGKRNQGYHWDKLPIPDKVIDKVEELARIKSQPLLTDKQPMFKWFPGVPIISTVGWSPGVPIISAVDDILDLPPVSDNIPMDESTSSISSTSNVPYPVDPHHPPIVSDDNVSFASHDENVFFF